MIVTNKKPLDEILKNLGAEKNIFLIGCGECSTTCKTGGEKELIEMKQMLIASGKNVTGYVIPKAPCVASQVIREEAKNRKAIEASDAILEMFCLRRVRVGHDSLHLPGYAMRKRPFKRPMRRRG